jgi:hypothetical protein
MSNRLKKSGGLFDLIRQKRAMDQSQMYGGKANELVMKLKEYTGNKKSGAKLGGINKLFQDKGGSSPEDIINAGKANEESKNAPLNLNAMGLVDQKHSLDNLLSYMGNNLRKKKNN